MKPKPTLPVGDAPAETATDAQEENVPLSQDASTIFEALQVVVGEVKAGAVTTDEIPVFDAFRQGLDKASDALKEAMAGRYSRKRKPSPVAAA